MNKLRLHQKQKLTLSPQQIQFLGLLQIPLSSIDNRIEEEIEKNPALEETLPEDKDDIQEQQSYRGSILDYNQTLIPEKEETLYESLLKQLLHLDLDKEEQDIAEYIIGCLDENGFLTRDLYIIENDILLNVGLEVSNRKLENILTKIQKLEPFGVGARNLQECLVIQLRSKKPNEIINNTLNILKNFYEPFTKKNFELIIKKSEISEKELKEIYIQVGKLTPNPGANFSHAAVSSGYIIPDFTVSFYDNQLVLKLNKENKKIVVSKTYKKMLEETNDKTAKEFISKKIESAQWFAEAIKERENTLYKVMSAILEFQNNFFVSGDEKDLKPMILMDIAEIVKMDISTISRVSNSKYVETSFGTFLLRDLFSEAYRKDDGTEISTKEIKSKLQEIIDNENKQEPFTDEQLSEMLGENEYNIARRTVAKYREQLRIPVSRLRRML